MNRDENGGAQSSEELAEVKKKLVKRIGAAGLMIVGLLGGLILFDRLGTEEANDDEDSIFVEAVPVGKKIVPLPTEPVPSADVPAGDDNEVAEPETSAPPAGRDAGVSVQDEPVAEPKPVGGGRETHKPISKNAASGLLERSGKKMPVAEGEVRVRTAQDLPIPPASLPNPSSAAAESAKVAVVAPRGAKGILLHTGVFTDTQRAEELQAKLFLEGIPSIIEARVIVGPFKNREDAETVRARLKSLGLEATLQASRQGKKAR